MLQTAALHFISFLVSWLPEPVKERRGLSVFNTVSAHVCSGIFEAIVALALLVISYFSALDRFTLMVSRAMTESTATACVDEGAFRGMGLLGLASFILQPQSALCYLLFAEGLIRLLSAALTGRNVGTLFLAIPYRLVSQGQARYQAWRCRSSFGPPRPDELKPADRTESGLLEIYSARQKPWHERQVLEYAGAFYRLQSTQPVRQDEHWAYCYQFQSIRAGEIIRGAVVRYSTMPAESAPEKI